MSDLAANCGPIPFWIVWSFSVAGSVIAIRLLVDLWRRR